MNKIVLLIDALASGFEIESAAALAALDIKEASQLAAQHQDAIDARTKEIRNESAIMLPSQRWKLLNRAAHMGVEGFSVAGVNGVKLTHAPALAIQAVKVANEMLAVGQQVETIHLTTVIEEMFNEMKQSGKTDTQAWELVESALPEYIGAIQQVQRRMKSGGKKKNDESEG